MAAENPGTAAKEAHDQKVAWFKEYLYNNREEWERKIELRLANGDLRIPLELKSLQSAQPGLEKKVLQDPVKYLPAYEEGLLGFLADTAPKALKSLKQALRLDLQGAFGRNHVTPRGMTAEYTGQLMCVEGLVTRCLVTKPKLLYSMHVRKDVDDNYVEQRDHRDTTSLVVTSRSAAGFPKQDSDKNDLQMDVAFSVYKDSQHFTIQETPDTAPPGQIPRSIKVICDGDLCDKAKPGDRVQVIGIYRSFPPPLQDFTDGVFPAKLVATDIKPVKELTEPNFTPEDINNIQKIAEREDTFQLLARSFAPSICGHERVKAGLLLQMLGGVEKNLSNGTHLRGDINVLLVGDPSCGKSQMLRFVMNTAPLAISTTGRGSSGVGLTAAMIRDAGSREFHLEAGAMVLADRGVICIDEFDKMNQVDRVAIHEAMEQQCVTIAKAGMHVTLNARCSVLAAANPIFGNFDSTLDLVKNIGLPDSLLSRFDLIFVVRDQTTEEIDRKIADQVLRQCATRFDDGKKRGVEQIHSSILERRSQQGFSDEPAQLFEAQMGEDSSQGQVVTVDFLQKYIRFARRRQPVLNEEARQAVTEKYVEMRMRFQSGYADLSATDGAERKPRLAVTTRTLEALIRLATAHAKLKLRLSRPPKSQHLKPLRLETLACDRNKLQQVEPGALSGPLVASLQVLDLSRNQLSFLPGDFVSGAQQLRYLDLSHNQLFGLPDSILKCTRLLILNVDNNDIEQLPTAFGRLTSLRKLKASYNALTQLPESIGDCQLLEKIRVVNNHITVMPHSLLKLWKRKGGVLEELLVDGNPLIQPSITAFQMGGLDQALRLFGEWIDSHKVEESQELPAEEEEHEEVAPETHRDSLRDTVGGVGRATGLFDSRLSGRETREMRHTVLEELHSEEESERPNLIAPSGDPDDFRLEDLELEVVQVIDESGKRLSKFAMSQSDLQRLQEGSSKPSSNDLLDPYYFSHVGDINEILSIRSAESAILILKKRYFVLRQQDIAMDLAHSARSAAELRRDLDRCPELWDLFRAKFDCMKYNGKVPLQDLDLYFCTLVYGSKQAFTSIHALWDKFEVGEKGYMTKDEWYNLCTRVQTKLPKHAQLDIWNLLAWRDKVHLHKPDFVAGWHVHDLELRDAHVKSIAGNLQLEYYGIKVEELQERMRMRLAEDSQVSGSHSRSKDTLVALPMGDGERWMKSDQSQVKEI